MISALIFDPPPTIPVAGDMMYFQRAGNGLHGFFAPGTPS
jgi:hypothetical protein